VAATETHGGERREEIGKKEMNFDSVDLSSPVVVDNTFNTRTIQTPLRPWRSMQQRANMLTLFSCLVCILIGLFFNVFIDNNLFGLFECLMVIYVHDLWCQTTLD